MEQQEPKAQRLASLIITHQCNLNCVYCYEKHKSDKRMDYQTAIDIISKEYELVKNSSKFDGLEVDFFGGEPLIAFDLIRQATDWIISQSWDIPHRLFVVTNGTLLNSEMKAYCSEHKDILTLGLSFDGSPEMQNANRSQSNTQVDLDFFVDTYPNQPLKMTISKETLPHLAEGVLYLQEKGFIVQPSVGCGMDWTKEDCLEYEQQLYILAQTYLNTNKLRPIDLLIVHFSAITQPIFERTPCGAGDSFETYDVDGSRYPCHMFTPLVQIESISEQFKNLEEGVSGKLDPNCEKCLLVNICDPCRGYNLSKFGSCERRDTSICDMFQSQCRVASWYQIQLFEQRKAEIKDCSPEEMQDWKGLIYYQRHPELVGYGRE